MVHVPRLAGDADGLRHGRRVALRVVGVRNRAGAVVGHPDHDLVLVRATGGGGGEDVVGDVDDGIGGEVGEGPGPGGLEASQVSIISRKYQRGLTGMEEMEPIWPPRPSSS